MTDLDLQDKINALREELAGRNQWIGHNDPGAETLVITDAERAERTQVITAQQRERAVSSTGGQKDTGLAVFSDIPAGPLRKLAERYGIGRRKYPPQANGRQNWEAGYDFSLSFSALQRHAWAFWAGEDIDAETEQEHLVAVLWHAMALLEWCADDELRERFDDRKSAAGRGVDR